MEVDWSTIQDSLTYSTCLFIEMVLDLDQGELVNELHEV